MSASFFSLIQDMRKKLIEVDHTLSMNMFMQSTRYNDICVRSDISLGHFLKLLRRKWSDIAEQRPVRCPVVSAGDLVKVMKSVNREHPSYKQLVALKDDSMSADEIIAQIGNNLSTEEGQAVAFHALKDRAVMDILPYLLHERSVATSFQNDETFMNEVLCFVTDAGVCQSYDILMRLLRKYSHRYGEEYEGNAEKLERDVVRLLTLTADDYKVRVGAPADIQRLINVGDHLNELIPDSLGRFKDFVVKVIVAYYDNLHPIVSAHILCELLNNFEKVLPRSEDEAFSFLFKTILLNSGPLILKLLQMVTVALDVPTKRKYGLERLEYPLINSDTVDDIFASILAQPQLCDRVFDISASVGHVRIMRWNDYIPGSSRSAAKFVVKIIKPVTSAMTSCWEYEMLSRVFDPVTDKSNDQNIRQMLINNGEELDLSSEGIAMKRAHALYTSSYSDLFNASFPMTLTTIREMDDVLSKKSWQAIAMELAPGVPLTKCVDDPHVMDGGQTQAALYRAFDMLTERFVFNLIEHGFAHGDLHAGNIFFSKELGQMTIIDWGAIVDIDLFSRESSIDLLRHIVIDVCFFDFASVVDSIVGFLGDEFDAKSHDADLRALKERMQSHTIDAIEFHIDHPHSDDLYDAIYGQQRIDSEGDIRCLTAGPKLRDDLARGTLYERYDVDHDTTCESRADARAVQWTKNERGDTAKSERSTNDIIVEIIQFFVEHDIDVQSRFPELLAFQKAYALLLGVFTTFNYNAYRLQTAILRASLTWRHWRKLYYLRTLTDISLLVKKARRKFRVQEDAIRNNRSTFEASGDAGGSTHSAAPPPLGFGANA